VSDTQLAGSRVVFRVDALRKLLLLDATASTSWRTRRWLVRV